MASAAADAHCSCMHVLELWRYPVKSMRGVSVSEAEIRGGEVVGDRLVQVV